MDVTTLVLMGVAVGLVLFAVIAVASTVMAAYRVTDSYEPKMSFQERLAKLNES